MTMYCWSRSGSAATLNARETKMPTSQSGMRPAGRLRPVSLVAECTLVSPLGFFPRSDLSLPFVVTAPPPPLPQGEANTCTDGGIRPPFPWNSAAVRRRGGAMTPGGIKAFSSVRTSSLKRKTTTTTTTTTDVFWREGLFDRLESAGFWGRKIQRNSPNRRVQFRARTSELLD